MPPLCCVTKRSSQRTQKKGCAGANTQRMPRVCLSANEDKSGDVLLRGVGGEENDVAHHGEDDELGAERKRVGAGAAVVAVDRERGVRADLRDLEGVSARAGGRVRGEVRGLVAGAVGRGGDRDNGTCRCRGTRVVGLAVG